MSKLPTLQGELRSINYGHFGNPSYDPTLKEWTFAKLTESNAHFEQISNVEETAPATGQSEKDTFLRDVTTDLETLYNRSLQSEVRLLVSSFPELQPCETLVDPLVRLSEGIARTLADCDPAMTDVLDTGYISYTTEYGQETVKLLAFPGGECGQALRLYRLDWRRYRTEDDQEFELQHASEETGWWMGKGAPILQVCFSHGLDGMDRNALLAVRIQGCILFMFPRYRNSPVQTKGLEDADPAPAPRSRIDPNILFELHPDHAQGERLADVAFNPWNHRQFVVTDQRGQWTTFQIARRDKEFPIYEHKVLERGCMLMVKEEEVHEEEEEPAEKGGEIVVNLGEPNASEDQSQTEEEEEEDWTAGIPKIKTSASRKSSPALQDVPGTSASATRSESGSTDQDMPDAIGQQEQAQRQEPDADEDEGELPEIRQDGWVRALWVLNENTLVVCSRRAIHIVNRATNEYFDMPKLRMVETRNAGWFLDIKSCQGLYDHIFILTSYAIFVVRIFETEQLQMDEEAEPKQVLKGRVVIAALHYRDPADTTLRTSICEDNDGYLVTIFSQFNKIMSCFRFDVPQSEGETARASGTMALRVPEGATGRTLGVMAKRIHLEEDLYSMPSGTSNDDDRLHSFQFLGRDYGLRHAFFDAMNLELGSSRQLEAPHKLVNHAESTLRHRKSSFVIENDEDDELEFDNAPVQIEESQNVNDENEDEASEEHEPQTVTTTKSGATWIRPRFYEVARAAVDNTGLYGEQLVSKININDVPEIIEAAMEIPHDPGVPARTLFEHLDDSMPMVDDLRDASFQLEDALNGSSASAMVKLYPRTITLPLEADVHADEDEKADREADEGGNYQDVPYDEMHTYIHDQYVSTLNEDFSDAFKEQRSWLARSIAAEVLLSSARVEYKIKEDEELQVKGDPGDLFVGSSLRTGDNAQELEQEKLEEQAMQRSPYARPVAENVNTILTRLRRNARITPPGAQKWALKPLVLLDHWELGTDPAKYDHVDNEWRLADEKKYLSMSESERQRAKNQQDRVEKTRKREIRKAQEFSQMSSQAPSIISSQAPGIAGSQASQRPPRSSQIPGFGSQRGSAALRPPRDGSQISIPGLAPTLFPLARPAARQQTSTPRADASQTSTIGTSQGQTPSQHPSQVAIEASQAAMSQAPASQNVTQPRDTQPTFSQPAARQPLASQTQGSSQFPSLPLLNLGTPTGSPAPSSQAGADRRPRKVTKRRAGF